MKRYVTSIFVFSLVFGALPSYAEPVYYTGQLTIHEVSGKACSGEEKGSVRDIELGFDLDSSRGVTGWFWGKNMMPGKFYGDELSSLSVIFPIYASENAEGHHLAIEVAGGTVLGELREKHIEDTVENCNFDRATLTLGRAKGETSAWFAKAQKRFDEAALRSEGRHWQANGEISKAISRYSKAVSLKEEVEGGSYAVAQDLSHISLLYKSLGDYSSAKPFDKRVLDISKNVFGGEHENVLRSLDNLAGLYVGRGDYDEAVPLYERALAIREKVLGPTHEDTLASLSNLAKVYFMLGDYPAAKPILKRVLVARERAFGPEHRSTAASLNNLAVLHYKLGDYDAAKPLYERALAIRLKVLGPEHNSTVESLNNLGTLYEKFGDYTAAKPLYTRALAVREKSLGPELRSTAASLNNLAVLHYKLGDYDAAKPLYERALAIRLKVFGSKHNSTAESLNNLAMLHESLGDYAAARPLLEHALAISEKVLGPEHEGTARKLGNLAGIQLNLGDYAAAKKLFERALEVTEKVRGPEHEDTAKDLNNLAMLHERLGDYAEAKPLLERSLSIYEKALGPEHPELVGPLNNLAGLYESLGDYASAKGFYKKAIAVSAGGLGPEHATTAMVLNNLAALNSTLGDYVAAKPLYERSLSIFEKALGPEHDITAKSLNNLATLYMDLGDDVSAKPLVKRALAINEKVLGPVHEGTAKAVNNLASLYFRLGDYAMAKPLYKRALGIASAAEMPEFLHAVQSNFSAFLDEQGQREAAIFFGKQAVNTIQGMRSRLTSLETGLQTSFLTDKEDVYKHLADLLIEAGRLPEAQQVMAMLKEKELFDFIRRDAGKDPRATSAFFSSSELPWADRYAQISQQLVDLGKQHAELKKKLGLSEEEKKRYLQLEADLKVGRKAFKAYLDELMVSFEEASRKRYAEVENRIELPKDMAKKLQRVLRDLGHGAVIIHYLATEEKLHIILTTPESQVARQATVSEKELNDLIAAYRETLSSDRYDPLSQAQTLYRYILAPIANDLKRAEARTLMVSLDGALRYLPLAALHDGERYVAENYRLALYTAASGLDLKDHPSDQWQVAGFGLSKAVAGLPPLKEVPGELEGIVRRPEKDDDGVLPGQIYLDPDFTLGAIRNALDAEVPVVHFASHFELGGNNLQSHLVLGDGKPLSLAQIEEDDYDFGGVELLTLSACNTAVESGGGSEIESFGALAQRQGAKGVLATLWPVADKSTGLFMQNLYRLHQESPELTKVDALRMAQLNFIKGDDVSVTPGNGAKRGLSRSGASKPRPPFEPDPKAPFSHPYYWAPFILMGNWL